MAISTTLGIIASSIVKVVNTKEESLRKYSIVPENGRRGVLLSTVFLAAEVGDSRTDLLQKYLKKSKENKSKNDKERLNSYYKRNYKDYFGYLEGTLKQKKEELTESEKGILEWLETNK